MSFKAPATIPGLQPEADRALGKLFVELQNDLAEIGAGQLVTPRQTANYVARLGEFVRTVPPAAGLLVLLPAASVTNQGRCILIGIESVASGGTVTLAVSGGTQKVNNASTVVFALTGLVVAYSTSFGWVCTLLSAGGGGSTPSGTGFRHVTAGVEDAASKLVDTADINNNQVTYAKFQQGAANTIPANATAGAANFADLAVGTNTVVGRVAGNIVAASLVNSQIAANTIDATKQAQMAANSVKANATAGVANEADLAVAVDSIVARFGGTLGSQAAAVQSAFIKAAGNLFNATCAAGQALGRTAAGADLGFTNFSTLGLFTSVGLQAFTANGTYTPTTGMKFCLVITTGSGGGGGGADNNAATAGFVGIGGGGGAGGTCVELFSAATIGASQAVTIGTAGAGGSATNGTSGTAGGNSTFGALHTANGGAGGTGSGLSAVLGQVSAGGAGGVPTGGLLNSTGGDGEDGWAAFYDSAGTDIKLGRGGYGGASFWGGGGKGNASVSLTATGSTAVTSAGTNGKAFGSGGSGAYCSTSITGAAGGTGAAGACLVVEFI